MDETIYKRSKQAQHENRERKHNLHLKWSTNSISMSKKITIGRDRSNTVVLNDPLVSRRHAIIEEKDGHYYIRDLNSTNATYVDRNPLKPGEEKLISPGAVINIGKSELKIT